MRWKNFVCFDFLWCFSRKLLTSSMISRTIWRKKENIPSALISTGKIFKDQKLHWRYGLARFRCLWKIYFCLSTPNCSRNHVITHTWCHTSYNQLNFIQWQTLSQYAWVIQWTRSLGLKFIIFIYIIVHKHHVSTFLSSQ